MLKSLISVTCSLLAGVALAGPADTIKAVLEKEGLHVDSVQPTPIKDLYEVQADGGIIYSDPQAQYVILGQLVNFKTKENLTEQAMDQLQRKMGQALFTPSVLKNAIKRVNGKGEREVIVFTDPNCPYCRRLEKELAQLPNATIYMMVVPLLGGRIQVEDFVCAKDPVLAWNSWMMEGKRPDHQASGCDQGKIEKNLALVNRLGVRGVPFLFFKNGNSVSGYSTLDDIEAELK